MPKKPNNSQESSFVENWGELCKSGRKKVTMNQVHVVSPINVIKTIDVIPTINVIKIDHKCNTNHKCNKCTYHKCNKICP